ncbi:carboxypeptidase-like regulatory domain-containing protein [Chryseolinea sp. T2]|uniref:carboxypeptidase-like regulatory domain-containing protein n=1 Tax=Chryseolinea sp. T2 TaxID=3129255 RepID=UPI003077086B
MIHSIIKVALALVCLSASAQDLYTIRGKVLGGPDNKPLPSASVFLANTSYGVISNPEGAFAIPNVAKGRYRLVVSYVGYQTWIINIEASDERPYVIILKPAATLLQELVVTDKREVHRRSLADFTTFKELFIGLSKNANKCKIVNDRALFFNNKGGILSASADSLLVIENLGLGYRITCLLENFTYNRALNRLKYRAQMVYEQLTPSDAQEERRFAANRLEAYYGSELHFMRALYNQRLKEEGFFVTLSYERSSSGDDANFTYSDTVLRVKSRLFPDKIRVPTLINYNRFLDSVSSTPSHPVILFSGQLRITYVDESEPLDYLRRRDPKSVGLTVPQQSGLRLIEGEVAVEPNGMVLQEGNLSSQGYWSWELVAESLPVDYDPEHDIKTLKLSTDH